LEETGVAGDMADEAQELILAENDAAVRATLKRAEAGATRLPHFDDCLRCGDPIGLLRRRALPRTPHCVDCAELLELQARRLARPRG
jgi:RNA polymerase-binding transcription factor DksA